jgi:hypothetical protein
MNDRTLLVRKLTKYWNADTSTSLSTSDAPAYRTDRDLADDRGWFDRLKKITTDK